MQSIRDEVRKANAAYRRASIRATRGGAAEEYRRLRTQREMTRAVLAILAETHEEDGTR